MEPKTDRLFSGVDRPEPLHLVIAARIANEIASGRLMPGNKLPGEHEMASAFNVSRNVIREAIACLRADGVIESRQGLGAFVLDPRERQAIRIYSNALENEDKLKSLFELRGLLEVLAAELAASRRTDVQLEAIRSALARMEGDEKLTYASVDADLDFHHRVAEATNNEYIIEFLNFMGQRIRRTIFAARASHNIDAIVETTIAEHRTIFEAISAQDVTAAGQAMRKHIDGAARRLGLSSSPK
ncbi:FCD domain-containing protein [Shinella sp. AETb1-6]|uniref:FadR/GntR family transcriptional regulator n=1 Tax=Shinella sp. AETb1-6 TaxID=2692210 RepID=UPI00136869EF|nr:FadR/GntR family transcriptional regulator [Shinella sp. AETb1-6]MXN53250.1 FCD domain-containing protein [Shinella sp. AETb1-6]